MQPAGTQASVRVISLSTQAAGDHHPMTFHICEFNDGIRRNDYARPKTMRQTSEAYIIN